MRPSWKILVAAAATLLVAPQFAVADDLDDQLQAMQERMRQIEEEIQATNEELAESDGLLTEQQDVLDEAGLARETRSGLSAFLSETQFSGLVAVSYNYNFNEPDASSVAWNSPFTIFGESIGNYLLTAPLHSNSNNFQVDQFWLSMMKPSTPESRAGWGVDLVFGAAADGNSLSGPPTGDLTHLYAAYAEYLFDVLENGVNLRLGRFGTTIGAESLRADENWQITRGIVWSMQPVNHTGVMVSTEFDNGMNIAMGAVNSYNNTMADYDNEKTFVGQVGWTGETASFHINGLYGGDVSDVPGPMGVLATGFASHDRVGLLDVVATWDYGENFSSWVNFDYYWTHDGGPFVSSMSTWGIAGAFRYAVTDNTGFSFRGEYLYFNDGEVAPFDFGPICPGPCIIPTGAGLDSSLFALTGTVDHALTDNLTLKVEARYDLGRVQGFEDNFFIDNESFVRNEDQVLALVQLMYRF